MIAEPYVPGVGPVYKVSPSVAKAINELLRADTYVPRPESLEWAKRAMALLRKN